MGGTSSIKIDTHGHHTDTLYQLHLDNNQITIQSVPGPPTTNVVKKKNNRNYIYVFRALKYYSFIYYIVYIILYYII